MNEPTIEQVRAVIEAVLSPAKRGAESNLFAGRLLGLRQAETILGTAREILVAHGTVVTPLAFDFLKKHRVALSFVAETSRHQGEWGLAVESTKGIASALREALREGSQSWQDAGSSSSDAARWVVSMPDRAAAVVTDEASVSVWKANAIPGVRAAFAFDHDSTSRAVRHLGVNLLVIEARDASIFSMKHMLATYRRSGLPTSATARPETDEDRRSDRPSHPVAKAFGPAERALRDRLAHASGGARRGLGGSG